MCAGNILTVFKYFIRNKVEKVGDNWEHATCTWAHNGILNDFYIIYILSIYI